MSKKKFPAKLWDKTVRDAKATVAYGRTINVAGPVLVAAVVFLVLFSVIMLALLASDLTHRANVETPRWAAWVTQVFLSVLGIPMGDGDDQPPPTYVGATISVATMIVAVFMIVIPSVAYMKQRRDVRRAAMVERFIIHRDGDDRWQMYDYFQNADRAIIFSGDFDWLLRHEGLRIMLLDLARKNELRLVSYRDERQIEQGWKVTAEAEFIEESVAEEILDRLKDSVRFQRKPEFKFALVRKGGDQWSFLSKVPEFPVSGQSANIGVRSIRGLDANAIVRVVRLLCDWDVIEDMRKWESRGQTP